MRVPLDNMRIFLVFAVFITFAHGWDWRRFGDSEYLIVYDAVSSYKQAENGCAAKGGHLANVKTTAIFNFLVQQIDTSRISDWPHDLFIGARKVTNNSPFKWTDGSVVDVFQWRDGEPSYIDVRPGRYENCMTMGYNYPFDPAFRWNDVPCSRYTHRYVCQRNAQGARPLIKILASAQQNTRSTSDEEGRHNPVHVPSNSRQSDWSWLGREIVNTGNDAAVENWIRFGDSEYFIVYDVVTSYTQAENGCAAKGGHLANVKTTEIFNFLVGQIDVSIVSNWPHDLFIGASKDNNTFPFKWTDGSVVDVFQWRDGEPSYIDVQPGRYENCMAMGYNFPHDPAFKWNDIPCSWPSYTHRYICERKTQ